jgi:hypothetical protein
MPSAISRPDKLTDAQTILYEIDMLRFAASRLLRGTWESQKDQWAYLECFLVHYRNLVEFLGKEQHPGKKQRPGQDTDLYVSNIWQRLGLPKPAQLQIIREQGGKLWIKYERAKDRISRYLHHCTTLRTESKSWDVAVMNGEIEPILAEVEKALTDTYHTWMSEPPVVFPTAASYSTATVGTVAAVVQPLSSPVPPKSK